MKILTIRTDSNDSELGWYEDQEKLAYKKWSSKRELARTILSEINELIKDVDLVDGIVVFRGPGSFTGLRIGITVANSLAYSLSANIVATQGNAWLEDGIAKLIKGENEKMVSPHYGQDVFITKPTK